MGGRRRRAPRTLDALGVAWVVLAAMAVLAPALRPGHSLGPFDLLARFGLTQQHGVPVHGAAQADQIQQFVPWTALAWHQVHSGQVPLWNPYNLLGMPLAFNWQSAVFSLPMAVGYLFPVHLAYTVVVLVKLIVAGTGAYVLCRVLGLGPLAATFGGVVFELSGPIVDNAGWPMAGVTAWTGWVLAAAVLVLRGRRPLRGALLASACVALAIAGGHPESVVVVALSALVFVAATLVWQRRGTRPAVWRYGLLGAAGLLGAGLAAPLLLPATQLGLTSSRGNNTGTPAMSPVHLPNLLGAFSGADPRAAAYVGVVALVLAVAGARAAWERPEVRGLVALVAVTAVLSFVDPVDRLLQDLPGARAVTWSRAVMVLVLGLAVLGAVGVDLLARRGDKERRAMLVHWCSGAVTVGALIVALVALWGVLGASATIKANLDRLAGPAVEVVVLFAVVRALTPRATRGRLVEAAAWLERRAAPVLLVTATAALVSAGAPFWSVENGYFPTTAGTAQLAAAVGGALVGRGTCAHTGYLSASQAEVGIRADDNIAYGVDEFWVYDPILPTSYLHLWRAVTGQDIAPNLARLGVFCAPITSYAEAKLLGVQFVIEPAGKLGPFGTLPAGTVGGEALYRVIGGASRATLVPAGTSTGPGGWYAAGSPVDLGRLYDGTWRAEVQAPVSGLLRLRLTAVPGWRATIDGRPLALSTWADGTMLEVRVPPGRHVVEVHYWPVLFSAGLLIALGAALALIAVAALEIDHAWRRRPEPATPVDGAVPGGQPSGQAVRRAVRLVTGS